jgi:hypothetical protein
MPGSSQEGKLFFRDWVAAFRPQTVLDVGPGSGGYGKIIREVVQATPWWEKCKIDAIEAYEPYLSKYNLKEVYDDIFVRDVRDFQAVDQYDLVIFGDVLEHLTKTDASSVFFYYKKISKFLWISLPIKVNGRSWSLGYKQYSKEWEENAFEKHQYDWEYDEIIRDLGPFLWSSPFPTVGAFIAEGDIK